MVGISDLTYSLRKTNHLIRKSLDAGLKDLGITTPQYSILNELELAPGLSNAELSRKCFVTAQTMNVILVDLEKRKLVLRQAHPSNRKVKNALLTPEGTCLVLRARQKVGEVEMDLFEHLTHEEAECLITALSAIGGTRR